MVVSLNEQETKSENIVIVRNAVKAYGWKASSQKVLDGLNMTIEKGTIYGLLGASGCGKTTILSCLIGQKKLDSGDIWILGQLSSQIGSTRVGYMPQEISLYNEFTIEETLNFFGRISGVSGKLISEKYVSLCNLLQLPKNSNLIRELSGGQQRRVSLAVALLNDSELLILDEPTVGIEPILREILWDYFTEITKNECKTIIITTHYIDETRRSNCIGFMRHGKLLAESSPETILQKFETDSLEEVFLKLCKLEMGEHHMVQSIVEADLPVTIERKTSKQSTKILDYDHVKALLWKNILWNRRNIIYFVFNFCLPIIIAYLFCTGIGHDAEGINVGLINDELLNNSMTNCPVTSGCNYTFLSCRFISHLKKGKLILTDCSSPQEAHAKFLRNEIWATLEFSANYSNALMNRLEYGQFTLDEDVEASKLFVLVDNSDYWTRQFIEKQIRDFFADFIDDIILSCDYNEKVGKIPINFEIPIYGDLNADYRDFTGASLLVITVYMLSITLTGVMMLVEKNEGILERCLISGINHMEFLFAYLFTQAIVMAIQVFETLFLCLYVYGITNRGDLITAAAILLLLGLCGLAYGLLISCSCDTERTAFIMLMGNTIPSFYLSGMVWPSEGMHWIARIVSYCLPTTHALYSLRSILQKGSSIFSPDVYSGFIIVPIFICLNILGCLVILKFRKK